MSEAIRFTAAEVAAYYATRTPKVKQTSVRRVSTGAQAVESICGPCQIRPDDQGIMRALL